MNGKALLTLVSLAVTTVTVIVLWFMCRHWHMPFWFYFWLVILVEIRAAWQSVMAEEDK